MNNYRDLALDIYGCRCELCGYQATVEVHHIDYTTHQDWENKIRAAKKLGGDFEGLLEEAKGLGFLGFEYGQLSKDDRSTNLSVLCPNCHRLVHAMDVGINLLKVLPKRK